MSKTMIIVLTVPSNEGMLLECVSSIILNTDEKNYGLFIYKHDWKGFAVGMNHGIKIMQQSNEYDSCVLVSDDVIVKKGWLTLYREIAEKDKNIGIIGPNGDHRDSHVGFYCPFITRACIDAIGLLDEQFLYGEMEDVDYCLRAMDAGFKLDAVTLIICDHKESVTLKKMSPEMIAEKDKNKARFKEKWKGTKWENEWK